MKYEDLLKEHQLKVTPQRLAILTQMDNAGHISIESLFVHIKVQFSSLSLATLYKNIHAMLKSSLIKEIKVPEQKPLYELQKREHAHVVCLTCKRVEDIEVDTQSLSHDISIKSHFSITQSDMIFSGICQSCQ